MANIHLLLPCLVLMVRAFHGPDLPPGPYCGLNNQCCPDRQDECSHPILDTMCYCDEMCMRNHDDCCPDYEEVCLGVTPSSSTPPPENITLLCNKGQKMSVDCNTCTCITKNGEPKWDCEEDPCILSDDVISNVSLDWFTWKATNYSDFYGKKLKDGLVYKLGTFALSEETKRMGAISYDKDIDYPINFDARTKWGDYITPVEDQGWCGSDWAMSIASVTSDRFAIQSSGSEKVVLSPQIQVSCNVRGQKGCKGGNIDVGWNFVRSHGLVPETCSAYAASDIIPCFFMANDDLIEDGCVVDNPARKSRYKVGPPAKLKNENDIKYDIINSGPVQALMTVYQDFFHYREGVYRSTPHGNQELKGYHSVRIIGWGEEKSGDKFWTVANSWGTHWGENGFFRIARGEDMAGIESFVITVLPEVVQA